MFISNIKYLVLFSSKQRNENIFRVQRPCPGTTKVKKMIKFENMVYFLGNSNQCLWNRWRQKQLKILPNLNNFSCFVEQAAGILYLRISRDFNIHELRRNSGRVSTASSLPTTDHIWLSSFL